jgi:hypothetical protein
MVNQFFTGKRLALLERLLDTYHEHQADGTVDKFWPNLVDQYLFEFPEDDVQTPAFVHEKTLSGKKSLKRPEGIEKPIREVSTHFLAYLHVTD